jgi:hypothetical protein
VPLYDCLQIHQLNSTWSEARKASYVRHAVREYTIHKALHHRNIVSLTDIFEVGAGHSFSWLRHVGDMCLLQSRDPAACMCDSWHLLLALLFSSRVCTACYCW